MNRFLADWRLHWFLLLLPVALFLPAVPIDETRYLSVAWEMRYTGNFLLLHLNGAPYSDKGPLLFWLINLAWTVAGLQVWIVRLGMLGTSLASLFLFDRLARRLNGDVGFATRATTILAGTAFFALFANLIMFDMLLTACVLLALHGVLDLDARRWLRGTLIFALGLGLGLLNKGPVMLLDACLVALLAPWWSATARQYPSRWYACLLLGVLGSAVIGLAYMLVAGGWGYVNDVLFRQTAARMTKSFAHARPIWWYLMVLPFLILPWIVSLRAPWRAWRNSLTASKAARFGIAWFLPAFLVFCKLSGKQPHYLLPLLPGLALYFAHVLGDDAARVRGRLFGLLLVLLGLFLAVAPYLAEHAETLVWFNKLATSGSFSPTERQVIGGIWPLWGALLALLGVFLLAHPRAHAQLRSLSLSAVAAITLGMLTLVQAVGPTFDVSATAARIRAAQESGKPIVHLGWHHGLFEFPGRLTKPLEKVDFANLYTWCAAHPDGEIVTFYTKYPIAVKPMIEIPYRLGHILIWRAADLCAGPRTTAPGKPDEDETPED
ncbi:MAG TPA: glycosyltransferase family 39 protein [Rudaea sp.]|jgi:4-amino-4-deoxy-L-arabinose transferase-like glycosyltransferase|uniref:ArnT family glycosyltransferase n=1 Tax=Rudaea sp. TaxID=2136325 RepID=UPI002F91E58B